MENIKALFTDYQDIIKEVGEAEIKEHIQYLLTAIENFISNLDPQRTKIALNDKVLQYCIMDYYSDIKRLQEFHEIEKINDIKRVAYESMWILRRKPIQVISDNSNDDSIVFSNERFVLSYLTHEMLKDRADDVLTPKASNIYSSFVNSLYYHLKFRNCDAKVLELMMLSFKAGLEFNNNAN